MADILVDALTWSSTPGSNNPSGATNIGTGLDDNLRAIQAGIKAMLEPLSTVAGTNTVTAAHATLSAYAAGFFTVTPANTNTGATTLNINSLGAKNVFCGGAACVGGELRASVPVVVFYDGTQFNIIAIAKPPTRQVFTSGSAATYTTPANCRRIHVRIKGGGGGGVGSGTSSGNNGNAGALSSFNSIAAGPGGAGTTGAGDSQGGAGGTGGAGTASLRIAGAYGFGHVINAVSATNSDMSGGYGGGQGCGRGGRAATLAGVSAIANSGGGGGGAGLASQSFANTNTSRWGAGGGEGEYAEVVITSPAASYTYTIGGGGPGGIAGTSGGAGGDGAAGFIVVDEFY